MLIDNLSNNSIWAIQDAKVHLSELLRKADKEPQFLGKRKTYVVIPKEEWEESQKPIESMGRFLVENFRGIGELELTDRNELERETPFQ